MTMLPDPKVLVVYLQVTMADWDEIKKDLLKKINDEQMVFDSYRKRLSNDLEKFEMLVHSGKMTGGSRLDVIIEKQKSVNVIIEKTVFALRESNREFYRCLSAKGIKEKK